MARELRRATLRALRLRRRSAACCCRSLSLRRGRSADAGPRWRDRRRDLRCCRSPASCSSATCSSPRRRRRRCREALALMRATATREPAARPARRRSCGSGDGPLTRELVLTPGGFGLGQVPARLEPDATTTMVCGFCSTGCGLNVHLQRRRGGQPDAGARLPGQPRHGLPEGLGGADAAARARPRDHAAAARARRRRLRAGRLGARARRRSSSASRRSRRKHGPAVGRLPRHRPDRRPRRWRCSARSPSSAWAWSTATATRASAWPPRSSPTSSPSASTRRRTPTPTSRSPT